MKIDRTTFRSFTLARLRRFFSTIPPSKRIHIARQLTLCSERIARQLTPCSEPNVAWSLIVDACDRLRIADVSVHCDLGLITGSPRDRWGFGSLVLGAKCNHRLMDWFRDILANGGTYIDIGANIGLTLIPIANLPDVTCIGFEPDPQNFSYLKRNIETNCNRSNQIRLHQLALFDKATELQFERSFDNFGDHRIRAMNDSGANDEHRRKVITVRAARLDDLINVDSLARPIVVKIDTQGAEPFVFAGGSKTLSAANALAFEVWPYGMRRLQGDFQNAVGPVVTTFNEGRLAHPDSDFADNEWTPLEGLWPQILHRIGISSGTDYFDVYARKATMRT